MEYFSLSTRDIILTASLESLHILVYEANPINYHFLSYDVFMFEALFLQDSVICFA